jgi:ATP-binding cassette, subfamily F, member 3
MIDFSGVSLQFNGKYLFRDISYKISYGDKISLVGANGTGKSSILKIIKGDLSPESGKVLKQKRINIGYLPQEQVAHSGTTLLEEAKSALKDLSELKNQEEEVTSYLETVNDNDERDELILRLGEIHHKLEELDYYSAQSRVEKILVGLGFGEKDFLRLTNEFSGGWQMRIALSKILIAENDLLLLDEPTNHLDLDSLEWLIGFLKSFKGALLIVSHDKHFINEVTNRTLEIFLNKFYTYNGTYDDYIKYKEERDTQSVNLVQLQQRKIKETERFIERFRYKASKAKQVQSRIKQLEKIELIELPESRDNISIRFPEAPPSGIVPMKLNSVSKSYGDIEIFRNVDFEITRGEKIAFVGPNGAGKTTLAKIIAGVLNFNGERITGHNTLISYYAQDVADELDPLLDIIESIEGINEKMTLGQLRSLLGSFLFSGDDVFKKVGVLSGGEKSRVALAKILLQKANLIILDEPTNHLDISSKEVLQKALLDYKGSLVLVSHDVDFLRPLADKVVEIKEGRLKVFSGDIDYYLSKREEDISVSSVFRDNSEVLQGSRKDQKRTEAERRQKKYAATKELLKNISRLEKDIEALEAQQKEIETLLADPSFYSKGEEVKEKTLSLNKVRKDLEEKINKWTSLSEELSEIEKQFS